MRKAALALAAACAPLAAAAGPFEGVRKIKLLDGRSAAIEVGEIAFSPAAAEGAAAYRIEWLDEPFADHFLSMRPFKCLEGPGKHWCRAPYPYENRREVREGDLTDLEYDLLFVWKGAGEYGIDMWNGVYYRLAVEGDRIVGRLNEIDLDRLSAPPPPGELRPVRAQDLEEGDPDGHWLPALVIE
ncbi:MAG: hypothetical protein AAGF90_00280 [Pseudomonadota bacterium]